MQKTRRMTRPQQRALGEYLRAQAHLRRITTCESRDPDIDVRCQLTAGHPKVNPHRHRMHASVAVVTW